MSASIVLLLLSLSFAVSAQERDKEEEKHDKEELLRERESERSEERARARYKTGYHYAQPAQPTAPAATAYSVGDNYFMVSSSGSSSSQLSLSKKFDGDSNENEGSFDVDDNVRHISLSFSGSVEEGAIEIVIILPDGDELKDITIDTSADITFTQTIKIAEDEDKYYGEWTYSVEADEAIGYYRLSINTR